MNECLYFWCQRNIVGVLVVIFMWSLARNIVFPFILYWLLFRAVKFVFPLIVSAIYVGKRLPFFLKLLLYPETAVARRDPSHSLLAARCHKIPFDF